MHCLTREDDRQIKLGTHIRASRMYPVAQKITTPVEEHKNYLCRGSNPTKTRMSNRELNIHEMVFFNRTKNGFPGEPPIVRNHHIEDHV